MRIEQPKYWGEINMTVMKEYCITLELAMNEESKGNFEEALVLYRQALKESGDDVGVVLFEMGAFLFSREMYEEALGVLIKCHNLNYKTAEIEQMIMHAYYEPNIDEFKDNYEKNISTLSQYEHIYRREYPSFCDLNYRFIPYSETKFAVFNVNARKFIDTIDLGLKRYNIEKYKSNDVIIIKNEVSYLVIEECLDITKDTEAFLWAKIPMYLYYEEFYEFVEFLQICSLTKALDSGRLVFLFGINEVDRWFKNPQSIIPGQLLNVSGENDHLCNHIGRIFDDRDNTYRIVKKDVERYYEELDASYFINKFKGGKPSILFVTTRFSTAIQYFTRDCMAGCESLGIPNALSIETSDIHRSNEFDWMIQLRDFKPDAIFIIDHFRWEYPYIPKNIIFMSWVHDMLPHIMSSKSASKIKEKDFVLNLLSTSKEFLNLGYPRDQVFDTPIPINANIYKTHVLSDNEIKKYGTDICVISNPGDPLVGLEYLLSQFRAETYYSQIEKALNAAYEECYKLIFNEQPLHDVAQHKEILIRWLEQYNIRISENVMNQIVYVFRQRVVWIIYRSVPIEWLSERGYRIKLWGKEWLEHPKLKKYAQGVAQNGDTLSRILNASKILIGTNPAITTHPRVFEAIMSNCFYLGLDIPLEYDVCDIRKFMELNKEVVLFESREDLYQKVDFYLNNKEERLRIIENGKKKILSTLTYEKMMNRVIYEVAQRLEKQNSK